MRSYAQLGPQSEVGAKHVDSLDLSRSGQRRTARLSSPKSVVRQEQDSEFGGTAIKGLAAFRSVFPFPGLKAPTESVSAWRDESKITRKELNKIMDKELNIVYVDQPEWAIIGGGISNFNKEQAGEDNAQTLCFVLRGPDQEIVGGVIGATYWDWLHVDLMWIREEHRGRGYGHRLLTLAEEEARKRGAKNAYLDTFSFQAPDFYKKHGYEVFGELQEFPHGHRRYFLTKQL